MLVTRVAWSGAEPVVVQGRIGGDEGAARKALKMRAVACGLWIAEANGA
jgi:hypothetical protein